MGLASSMLVVHLGVSRLRGVLAIGHGWLNLKVSVGASAVVLTVLIGDTFSLRIVCRMVRLRANAELVTVLPDPSWVRLLIMLMLSVLSPQVLLG